MKALITGGAGFIGSHLAEVLLADGAEVVLLDDLSTGRLDNVRHLLDNPRVTFVHGSVLDPHVVRPLVDRCDQVYHLAAAVGVRLVVRHPVRTIETNVRGTQVVLEAAVRSRRPVFLSSTSEVYGKDVRADGERFRESDDVTLGTSLRWCYASSKALDEYLARAYHLEKGLPVVIGRFFNTVGPRQSDAYGMVVPRFVRQALAGEPITVYGDGAQVRSFGWVGDVVRAAVALMKVPQAAGEVFNIGSDEPVTIRDLAGRVKTLADSRSEIVYVPYEAVYGRGFEDIRYRVPDISKLRRVIGYRPTRSLDDILRAVIDYEAHGRRSAVR
jgi:UDP-glucose 4-epimerase